MNTKQAGVKWGVNHKTAGEYCRQQIIPGAEKKGRGWDIPDNAIKPPLSRNRLALILDNIVQIKYGAAIDWETFGFDDSSLFDGCDYLMKLGCMSGWDSNVPDKSNFPSITITPRGEELINARRTDLQMGKLNVSVTAEAGVSIGVASGKISGTVSK